jgi:hypothetical protein
MGSFDSYHRDEGAHRHHPEADGPHPLSASTVEALDSGPGETRCGDATTKSYEGGSPSQALIRARRISFPASLLAGLG